MGQARRDPAVVRFRDPLGADTAFRVREEVDRETAVLDAVVLDTAFRVVEGLVEAFRDSAFRGGAFAVADLAGALLRTVPPRLATVRATGVRRDEAADLDTRARAEAGASTVRSSTVSVSPLRWTDRSAVNASRFVP